MSVAPQFVSLSMCITGRAWGDSPNLSWMDCISYAIERESDPVDLPPLVAQTINDALRYAGPSGTGGRHG